MRNAITSIVLFIIIMICMFFLNNSLISLCNTIEEKTIILENTLLKGDYETAYSQSLELLDVLNQHSFTTSVYASHQDFDSLNDEMIKLSIYTTYEDYVEADASLHAIKYNARHIKKLQMPFLENIL